MAEHPRLAREAGRMMAVSADLDTADARTFALLALAAAVERLASVIETTGGAR